MDPLMQVPMMALDVKPLAGLTLRADERSQILTVCERDSDAIQLKAIFKLAGLASESASSIAMGCEAARSGRFGVVFSTPHLGDGSWIRFIEVASQLASSFEIVLLARTFDLNQWGEAIQLGAFDVLDVLRDLPRVAEVARRALGATYLRHFRRYPGSACS